MDEIKENKKKKKNKFIYFLAKVYVFFGILKKKPKYIAAFLGLFLGIGGAAAILIVLICKASTEEPAKTANDTLRESYVTTATQTIEAETEEEPDSEDRWAEAVWSMEQDADDALWYGAINVDMTALQELNPDIIGWIYFEAADISYPVLYSGDDEEYLRTTYDGKYETGGSIFLEGLNKPDFTDKHMLIYGHNMKNLTMFGQLKLYKTETDYYENHQYFQLIYRDSETGETVKERYHIFACKDVSEEDDVYYVYDSSYTGLASFATNTLRAGNYLAGTESISVGNSDQVITLSTCSSNDDRFVVSAVKCAECRVEKLQP